MSRKITVFAPMTLASLEAIRDDQLRDVVVCFSDLPASEFSADDIEQAEFDALTDAAALSVQRLVEVEAMPLRVVLAAVVPHDAPEMSEDGDYVVAAIPRAAVTAIYVDELEASKEVNALISAVRAGRQPTDEQYEKVETRLLLWHEPTEIDNLIEAYPH
ncbi:DUF6912 family protein [Cumulibacter soli]|uniref:DUF6912 family protein n=1 Tax=Cumulibacter soli TaxID=2546344 RepID=UPI0010689366|nr:hypothetical protein [Cumulibacter soli]